MKLKKIHLCLVIHEIDSHPVSLSCKTAARDRWKQAAYEAMALKRVYAQATNYLLTIEDVGAVKQKQIDAPQTIDHYIKAIDPEFDMLVQTLARCDFCAAETISPIIKGNLVQINRG